MEQSREYELNMKKYASFLHAKSKERAGGGFFRVYNGAQFLGTRWGYNMDELSLFLRNKLVSHTHLIELV